MRKQDAIRDPGNHEATRLIRIKEGARIMGRRPGMTYEVDAALARHYCEVLDVAEYVDGGKKGHAPATVEDRAMQAPPRGRGRRGK